LRRNQEFASRVDEYKPTKYASHELILAIEKAQQDNVDVKRIFNLAEAQKIDGYISRGGILFKDVDNDLRIVVASLRPQVIRQAYERRHFLIAKTEVLLNQKYWIPNIRNKIQKENKRGFNRKRKKALTYHENDLVMIKHTRIRIEAD